MSTIHVNPRLNGVQNHFITNTQQNWSVMLVLIVTFAAFVAGAGIITIMNAAPKGARR